MARGGGTWMRLESQGSWAAGVAALLRALDHLPRRARIHIEQPLDGIVEPLAWLARRAGGTRVFLENRERDGWIAGVGSAVQVDGRDPGVLNTLLQDLDDDQEADALRFLAWARFDLEGKVDDHWAPFGVVRAFLPLVELRKSGGGISLIAHLVAKESKDRDLVLAHAVTAISEILVGDPPLGVPTRPVHVGSSTREAAWKERVQLVLRRIEAGTLRKAVITRVLQVERPHSLSPWVALAELRDLYPGTYPFAIQLADGRAFLGASPERLYRRRGLALETEALAGTALRSVDADEDARLADALLESPKDRLEHELVRLHLMERLTPLCDGLTHQDVPEVIRLRNLQHLRTSLRGTLRRRCTDADLLNALHPTPAVCGLPFKAAMDFLRQHEDFDRGLYCGPVGWFGRNESEFSVALRSAWTMGRRVRLFAGAGVVQGSDASAEWNETVAKMRALEAVVLPSPEEYGV